jgi:hypothetical protein
MPIRLQEKSRSKNNNRYSSSQLFNFARDSYLERTGRPIYALAYLLPFIVIYEIGTFLINTDILSKSQIRVVAFVWLEELLDWLGFGSQYAWIAAPAAVIVILLALQLTSRTSWKVNLNDFVPITGECIAMAIPLIVLSLILNRPMGANQKTAFAPERGVAAAAAQIQQVQNAKAVGVAPQEFDSSYVRPSIRSPFMVNLITGIGAGIYEELVFRLVLICVLMMLLQDVMGLTHLNSLVIAILLSAGLFSAHHHIIFMHGRFDVTSAFSWPAFTFRTVAGVYFAAIFAVREFGVTAGTHAFYDIMAAAVNAIFFSQAA